MAVSPFTFYRGAAAVMAADLATQPRTRLHVQLCGDAHLSNFGVYASPERNLVFDLNDFDETLPGPFEWDTKRLAASFVVAGQSLGWSKAFTRRMPAVRDGQLPAPDDRVRDQGRARHVVLADHDRGRGGVPVARRARRRGDRAASR